MKKNRSRGTRRCRSGMSAAMSLAAVMMTMTSSEALSQQHPMMPRGEFVPQHFDSGPVADPAMDRKAGFAHVVHVDGARWTRLFFNDVILEGDSTIRFTSLLDGQVQELDARGIAMWNNASAFFNGSTILIELIPGAGTTNNRFILSEVAVEYVNAALSNHCTPPLQCGICNQDDRIPSNENWAPRLLLASGGGCSSAIVDTSSCVISAGHCMSSTMTLQFNVPQSNPDCTLNHPSVEDQFPIIDYVSQNGGVGADWAVLRSGTNNLGQMPYERYGEYRPIAPNVPASGPVDVWGYGVSDDCTLGQSQQHSTGNVVNLDSSAVYYSADVTCGNSGSSLLQNDEIIGVVTHCTWNCPPEGNIATRVDVTAFANARAQLCPDLPVNDICDAALVVNDGETAFTTLGASTTGPEEAADCTFEGDGHIQRDVWFEYTASCTGEVTISLCDGDPPPPPGPCDGICGGQHSSGCWCDHLCDTFGDCCDGVCNDCPNLPFCSDGGGGFDTKLAVYGAQCPTSSGSVLDCNKDACGVLSELTITAIAGQTFKIRVGGHNGETGDGVLTITCEEADIGCPADLDGNGVVDGADLLILLSQWGPCAGCPADLDGNGVVDGADLLILLAAWGQCP